MTVEDCRALLARVKGATGADRGLDARAYVERNAREAGHGQ